MDKGPYGYFACGEYLAPCRALASGVRSAAQMRTHAFYALRKTPGRLPVVGVTTQKKLPEGSFAW